MRSLSTHLVLVPVVVTIIAGCGDPLPAPAARQLEAALTAYRQGDDAAVIERTGRIIDDHADAQETGEAYYLRALARRRGGADSEGAAEDLQRALDLTRRMDLAARAHLARGLIADEMGDSPAAREHYGMALACFEQTDVPSSAHEEALFRLGALCQRQGEFLEADRHFDRLLHLYGQGRWAPCVRRRIRGRCWTLLAGTFDSPEQADLLSSRLSRAGHDARVVPVCAWPIHYAVHLGRHETYAQAADACQAVADMLPEAEVVVDKP